jgi:hypothetical protein
MTRMERFVVKATGPDQTRPRWLTARRLKGHRAFGPRELAAIFGDWNAAESAIHEMRKSEDCAPLAFEIEPLSADANSSRGGCG